MSIYGTTEKGKFSKDLVWNYAALGVLAASGMAINVIIVASYGASALGVFNQVYAIFIITSQLASGGVQFSVLKHVVEQDGNQEEQGRVIWSGVGLSLLLGVALSAVLFALSGVAGTLLESEEVTAALRLAAPGLLLYSMNKVMLGALNGLRHMRAFALGQMARLLLMTGFVVATATLELPVHVLGGTFTFAEAVLLLVLSAWFLRTLPRSRQRPTRRWLGRHFSFGSRGFMSGLIIEINSRTDILMLGLFLTDRQVGIYAFASMLAEGFYNLLVVVRNNVNPILVTLLKNDQRQEMDMLVRRVRRWVFAGTFALGAVLLAVYGPGLSLLSESHDLSQSHLVLALLVGGILLYSGFAPFDFILLQAGQPGYQSLYFACIFVTNVFLNLALIPPLGIRGAALATSLSIALGGPYLLIMVRQRLGFWLGYAAKEEVQG